MAFMPLARLHTLEEGIVQPARAGGREFLVIRQQGQFCIFDGRCPHAGQSLLRGTQRGEAIQCPGHGLMFSLKTGECLHANRCPALTRFPAVFQGRDVGVDLVS